MERGDENVAYLIALPAILLGLILKIAPLLEGLKLPLIDYNTILGAKNSPYIGLNNFRNLFSTYFFRRLVSNTLILKLGFIFITGAMALILGVLLSYITRRWIINTFIILSTIPFFIPTSIFSYILLETVLAQWVVESEQFRIVYIFTEALRSSGVLSLIMLSSIKGRGRENRPTIVVRTTSIFLLIQLSSILTIDFELLNKLLSPLVYNVGDTIDTYIYRAGILNGKINQVSAMWFIRFVVQFVLTLGIYYTIKHAYGNIKDSNKTTEEIRTDKDLYLKFFAIVGCCVYMIILYLPIARLAKSIWGGFADDIAGSFKTIEIMPIFIKHLSITLLTAMLNIAMTLLLAYPLTSSKTKGKVAYEIFLLILLVLGQGSMPEYLYFKDLGMIGTIYPYILNGIFSIMNVMVLAGIYNRKYSFSGFLEYLKRLYRPAIAFIGLQFIVLWNSYCPSQILHMYNPDITPPIILFESMVMSGADKSGKALLIMGALISMPSLIIGIALCIFSDRRIFISRIRK